MTSKWAYYNDIDPKVCEWVRQLIKLGAIAPGEVDERSIAEVHPDDIRSFRQVHLFCGIGGWSLALRQAGWDDDRPIWSGSAPCQPWSGSGQQKGFADKRHLWGEMFRLITELRPSYIIGEQVASKIALTWWDALATDLEGTDYAAAAFDLSGGSAGAPHIRSRLFWVAHANSHQHLPISRGDDQADCLPSLDRQAVCSGVSSGTVGAVGSVGDADCQRLQEPCLGQPDEKGHTSAELPSHVGAVDDSYGSVSTVGIDRVGGEGDCSTGEFDAATDHDGTPTSIPAPTPTFWDECEWIECRDGKLRPTGVGISPLVGVPNLDREYVRRELEQCAERLFSDWDDADRSEKAQMFARLILETRNVGAIKSKISSMASRVPADLVPSCDPSPPDYNNTQIARIMRLKGFGNSIIIPVAVEFIRSVMELGSDM